MKRRILTLFVVSALFVGSSGYVFAATNYDNEKLSHARTLNNFGLLQGTSKGFELDQKPTRLQGLIMFIRLLGVEDEALAGTNQASFSDVPTWGDKYVSYAETANLSKGVGNNKFGSNDQLNAKSYATFILRGLGYSDANGDFTYSTSLDKLLELKGIDAEYKAYLENNTFTRGDMAKMSDQALTLNLKNKDTKLIESLGQGTTTTIQYKLVSYGQSGERADRNEYEYEFKIKDTGISNAKYVDIGYSRYTDFHNEFQDWNWAVYNEPVPGPVENDISITLACEKKDSFELKIYFYDNNKNFIGITSIDNNLNNLGITKEVTLPINYFQDVAKLPEIKDGANFESGNVKINNEKVLEAIPAGYTYCFVDKLTIMDNTGMTYIQHLYWNVIYGADEKVAYYPQDIIDYPKPPEGYPLVVLFIGAENKPVAYTIIY